MNQILSMDSANLEMKLSQLQRKFTTKIYFPSEGVALLNETLKRQAMILFSASTSTPLSQKSATFFRFAISAGPWTVRSWNFIPIPSAIRGTGFFSLTARSITNFPATTLPAFFICRWQVIQRAGKSNIFCHG